MVPEILASTASKGNIHFLLTVFRQHNEFINLSSQTCFAEREDEESAVAVQYHANGVKTAVLN